jgi:hypothetical protein
MSSIIKRGLPIAVPMVVADADRGVALRRHGDSLSRRFVANA